MKLIIQKVSEASVTVDQKIIGKIGSGLLVLVGFTHADTMKECEQLIQKMLKLRIFPDEHKPMNCSVTDISGEILLVSQFTLYANTKKGNRPSFVDALAPDKAENLYNQFVQMTKQAYSGVVQTGEFGAHMQVKLVNDGPVTIELEA